MLFIQRVLLFYVVVFTKFTILPLRAFLSFLIIALHRFTNPQPDYSAFREASYGHSTLEIKNRTHAFYRWNRNDDGNQVATDTVIFYNQYWWVLHIIIANFFAVRSGYMVKFIPRVSHMLFVYGQLVWPTLMHAYHCGYGEMEWSYHG